MNCGKTGWQSVETYPEIESPWKMTKKEVKICKFLCSPFFLLRFGYEPLADSWRAKKGPHIVPLEDYYLFDTFGV